jgi:hypothetical protein
LPDAVTNDSFRGEQAADWFLHYNKHANTWLNHLHTQQHNKKYLNMQSAHTLPLKENTKDLRVSLVYSLMRYMNAAFVLDYLTTASDTPCVRIVVGSSKNKIRGLEKSNGTSLREYRLYFKVI